MLGVQNRDLRRASLISEIYSETAGPTGGNLEKLQQIAAQNMAANSGAKAGGGGGGNGGEAGGKGKGLEQAGISKETLKNHPMFRPKRVTKSGLSKLSKNFLSTPYIYFCMNICIVHISNYRSINRSSSVI